MNDMEGNTNSRSADVLIKPKFLFLHNLLVEVLTKNTTKILPTQHHHPPPSKYKLQHLPH
uniref:Uncharacterized protein n=1 Tax=Nelumbo nucifera TaxID=4432 RepID=A0A822ZUJ4_NELNU|nr:TPA_asm: hypothetical protein HUJ06_018494 [Nelumbo nucifera]